MALKYQTESLEGIPETVHDFYEQGENGYVLKVEGVVPKSQYDEVNQKAVDNATEAQRRRKTVERVLGKLGLDDASGLDDALDGLLSKSSAPKKNDDDQKAIIEQIRAEAGKEVEAIKSQLNEIRTASAASQLKASLMGVGFSEKVAEMVAQNSLGRIRFDESGNMRIMQPNGNPLAGSGEDGFATVADLSKELAAAMPELLTDTGKGGGGKPPASGSNGGAKTVTRSQFDAMSQSERADFSKSGGKVVDG